MSRKNEEETVAHESNPDTTNTPPDATKTTEEKPETRAWKAASIGAVTAAAVGLVLSWTGVLGRLLVTDAVRNDVVRQLSVNEVLIARLEGSTKLRGTTGDKGDDGDRGDFGPAGTQGPVGPRGNEGPRGETGPSGPQGPAGPRGDQGPRGVEGPRGQVGPKGVDGPTLAQVRDLVTDVIREMGTMYFGQVDGTAMLTAPRGTTTEDWPLVVLPLSVGRRPSLATGFRRFLPVDYEPGVDVTDRYLDQVTCYGRRVSDSEWEIVAEQVLSGVPILQPDIYLGIDVCCLLLAPHRE